MKIGIITLPFNHNYGGTLQCYALMTVLKEMGHNVCYINRELKIEGNIIKKIWYKYIRYFLNIESIRFIKSHIFPRTKSITSYLETEKLISDMNFDCLIAGSDQIWRLDYIKNIEQEAFLFFPNLKIKKISYAASFGTGTINIPSHLDWVKNALKDFDYISVRELSGINIIRKIAHVPAVCVLDPTLLLDRNKYIELASISKKDIKGKIGLYVLDDDKLKRKVVEYVSLLIKKDCYRINGEPCYPSINPISLYKMRFRSMYDWIKRMQTADFIITDSFHGMVFSIIFEKQFLVIGNYTRGMDRFNSLLSQLGIENRLINSIDDIEGIVTNTIDYKKLRNKLEELKMYSYSFIESALKSHES